MSKTNVVCVRVKFEEGFRGECDIENALDAFDLDASVEEIDDPDRILNTVHAVLKDEFATKDFLRVATEIRAALLKLKNDGEEADE
jgi:hypothetical protein